MGKCTITIEDLPGDKVKIVVDPSFETICKMEVSGHQLTSAQGYALALMNRAREIGKEKGKIIAKIPRLIT
jgi:hypothetical protein